MKNILLVLVLLLPLTMLAQPGRDWSMKGPESAPFRTKPAKMPNDVIVSDTAWYNSRQGGVASFITTLNNYRASYGIAPLEYSESASKAAKLQCRYLVVYDGATHTNPKYPTPMHRVLAVGHRFSITKGMTKMVGENCAMYPNPHPYNPFTQGVMNVMFNQYRASPRHNTLMLDTDPTKVGMYTIKKGERVFHVTVFTI